MQAQKLIYLANGWSMALRHSKLIEEPFEAWDFGPVVRKLYDALKRYGSGSIPRLIKWGDDTPFPGEMTGITHLKNFLRMRIS
jgi:uncharacterized phage-associated protein